MEVEQKISTNVEILQFIFKKLQLKDQIQLISVCKEFKYVIENFIWKWKFNEVTILELNDEYYIEFIDGAENKYDLTESECHTFFPVIAKHVKKLLVLSTNKYKLTDLYNFENLILLEFKYSVLTKNNLKSLAINCPKLETINFMYSQNFNSSAFDLNKLGQIESLAKVKSLKHLKIGASEIFDLSQLNEILNQFCLKSLHLESFLYKDEVEVVPLENCKQLENLTIKSCYEAEAWLQFEELYLKHFKNLTTLSLDGSDALLKDTNLLTLAECCNNLQELYLGCWNLNIIEFPPKLKLKKLTLKNCLQLTWQNLQQILCDLNLEEFVSDQSEYEGNGDFFYGTCIIADTLQVIDIKTKQNEEFLEFFKYVNKSPEKLKKFHYEYLKHTPFSTLREFATLCANVEDMSITNVGISIKDLMKLKNLKSLKFSIFPAISWSFLSTLLTHRTLENIFLEMSDIMESKLNKDTKSQSYNYGDDEDNLNDFDLPILKSSSKKESVIYENFKINLQSLKIPFMIFLKHQNLFLDLLNFKTKLKLELYCYYNPEERLNQTFLNKLLTSKKFPSHKKYIKILNRYYACSDLKDNFRTTVDDVSQNDGCLTVTL